jgi:regulator of sigma E protease
MLVAFGIGLFVLLIILHEFGHFFMAKKSGVEVEEFGLGFPPRITGRRFKNDKTLYSINWLPLGGFVKLKGEHEADKSPGSYGAAPFPKKTMIILAGVVMNLLAAAVILTILSWVGLPRLVDNQFTITNDTEIVQHDVLITYVEDGSAANMAGLEVGDHLVRIKDTDVDSSELLDILASDLAGQKVDIEYIRDNQPTSVSATIDSEYGDDGFLGVRTGDYIIERSTWSAPIRGVVLTGQFSWLTLQGILDTLGQFLMGRGAEASENIAGPVGIVVLLSDLSQAGAEFMLFFVAILSITLAVINALPIPALDGGRLFVSAIFKVLKKPLNAQVEERIHATGMMVLLVLVALVTVVDVRRFL